MASVFYHTSVLDVEVKPKRPRNKSKAVPGYYDPVAHDDYEYNRLTMEELFRIVAEKLGKGFDRWTRHFEQRFEDTGDKIKNNKRLTELQHQLNSHRSPRRQT